jgi:muramoyltetrapeptide carboxypeptidase
MFKKNITVIDILVQLFYYHYDLKFRLIRISVGRNDMEPVKPYALHPGDKIGIVAPSMHIINEVAVENGIAALKELGFRVELGPTVRSKYRNSSAVPEDRAREIMGFFTDPETKAIVCLIGGDTASQILKLLDYETIRNNPKIFSGMSDIGHLNLAFLARAGMVSIYGPDLTFGFGADKNEPATRYNLDLFMKCCTVKEPPGKIPAYTPWECWRSGEASGRLVGGYLGAVTGLYRTGFWPSLEEVILFWEALETQPHEIERQFTIAEAEGFFNNVRGMVVGKLVNCEETDYKGLLPGIREIILEITEDYGFPIIANADFGHNGIFMPMPEGIPARVDAAALSIELLEPIVE